MVLRNFSCLGLLIVALQCALPVSTAQAQAWLSDRSRQDGGGIKVGNLELHPGIGAEAGWQNNVFNADPGNNIEASALLRVSPSLFLETRKNREADSEAKADAEGGSRVYFRGGVSGQLYHYFEAYDRTDMGVGADLKLTINQGRPFSVTFDEKYKRDVRPFAQPGFSSPDIGTPAVTGSSAPSYARDQNTVGTIFQLATPGDLLKGSLGYDFSFDFFEDAAFSTNNNLTHTVKENLSWTFLPKTALFQSTDVSFQNYSNGNGNSVSALSDNKRVNTELGLNGALTPQVGLTLAAGYGAGFYDNEVDYESLTARVQARWKISETVKTSIGYQRSFQPTFQGNFARTDNIRADLGITMGGVFFLKPAIGVNFVNFGPMESDAGQGPRSDIYLDAGVSGEYRVTDWLAFTAEVLYVQDFSDYEYEVTVVDPATGMSTTTADPVEYQSGEVWLGVRAFY
jgi:hypothetical protein